MRGSLGRMPSGGAHRVRTIIRKPCESMIEIVRYTQRNVRRWRDGDMRRRWTAAGMLAAEQQFRRIIGYRDLAKLVIAIERHTNLAARPNPDRVEIAEPATVDHQATGSPPKFHDDPDIRFLSRLQASASSPGDGCERSWLATTASMSSSASTAAASSPASTGRTIAGSSITAARTAAL
jgi:hypothetical protein